MRTMSVKAISKEQRRKLLAEYGWKNSGRQWKKLRKALGLSVRKWVRFADVFPKKPVAPAQHSNQSER